MKKSEYNKIVKRLKNFPKELENSVKDLGDEKLVQKPMEGKWSVKEIVLHLLDCEIVHSHRLRLMLTEENPRFASFNQEDWAGKMDYNSWNLKTALKAYRTLRANNIFLFKKVKKEDWERKGTHEKNGEMTFSGLLQRMLAHCEKHLQQIESVKKTVHS